MKVILKFTEQTGLFPLEMHICLNKNECPLSMWIQQGCFYIKQNQIPQNIFTFYNVTQTITNTFLHKLNPRVPIWLVIEQIYS